MFRPDLPHKNGVLFDEGLALSGGKGWEVENGIQEMFMTEKARTTRPGTVQKIIKSAYTGQPEKAEIAVHGADDLYKEIRIENALVDGNGHEVTLKKGAQVEVKIEADPRETLPKQ